MTAGASTSSELELLIRAQGGNLTTADEAVKVVEPGNRVMIPIGSRPLAIADALAAHLANIGDIGVELSDAAPASAYAWFEFEYPGISSIVHEHWGGPSVRSHQRAARHDYLPIPFSLRFKGAYDEYRTPAEARPTDVVIVQTSLPDDKGFVGFGANAWNAAPFIRQSKYAIAEMSSHIMPCYGYDHMVHVSQFHALVHNDQDFNVFTIKQPEENHVRIAEHLGTVIHHGDTIQIGAGQAPSASVTGGAFRGKSDLGWHSEATIPPVIDLIREGVMNGKRKSIDTGLAVATSFSGNAEQMAFLRNHPGIVTRTTEYVHNVRTISSLDNMVAINAALMVDLSGQICADSIGHELMGGTGGQLEFAIGAINAKNGRSVTLVESTAGSQVPISTIVSVLPPGTVVTVPRLYADIIITEYGVARLWGKTVRERARELIAIAHPAFRDELTGQAKALFGA